MRVDIMGDARFDLQGRRVCVAGHSGMLGSALVRRLVEEDCRLLPLGREILDLRDQADARTTSVDFEDYVMDGFPALNRYYR